MTFVLRIAALILITQFAVISRCDHQTGIIEYIAAQHPTFAQAPKDVGRGYHADAILRDSYQFLEDEELTGRVGEIGQKIVMASGNPQRYQFRFAIINDPVPNAFATAGGYVYVTTGLLRTIETEDELAAVLGHEVAHVNKRHPMQTGMSRNAVIIWTVVVNAASYAAAQYAGNAILKALGPNYPIPGLTASWGGNIAGMAASQVGVAILNSIYKGYSEDQEFESDELGLNYVSKAGYKPDALMTVLDRLRKQSETEIAGKSTSRLHSSHDRLSKRWLKAKQIVAKLDKR